VKRKIPIDDDIRRAAVKFVHDCVRILQEHGDGAVKGFDLDETAYKVAEYPQQIRNLSRKLAKKKAAEKPGSTGPALFQVNSEQVRGEPRWYWVEKRTAALCGRVTWERVANSGSHSRMIAEARCRKLNEEQEGGN